MAKGEGFLCFNHYAQQNLLLMLHFKRPHQHNGESVHWRCSRIPAWPLSEMGQSAHKAGVNAGCGPFSTLPSSSKPVDMLLLQTACSKVLLQGVLHLQWPSFLDTDLWLISHPGSTLLA